jgi:hypothetical protein
MLRMLAHPDGRARVQARRHGAARLGRGGCGGWGRILLLVQVGPSVCACVGVRMHNSPPNAHTCTLSPSLTHSLTRFMSAHLSHACTPISLARTDVHTQTPRRHARMLVRSHARTRRHARMLVRSHARTRTHARARTNPPRCRRNRTRRPKWDRARAETAQVGTSAVGAQVFSSAPLLEPLRVAGSVAFVCAQRMRNRMRSAMDAVAQALLNARCPRPAARHRAESACAHMCSWSVRRPGPRVARAWRHGVGSALGCAQHARARRSAVLVRHRRAAVHRRPLGLQARRRRERLGCPFRLGMAERRACIRRWPRLGAWGGRATAAGARRLRGDAERGGGTL